MTTVATVVRGCELWARDQADGRNVLSQEAGEEGGKVSTGGHRLC